jgi:predicted ABC-type transport system involved in lysophospholipase L1 biosynthesis ATPase subunit
VTTGVSAPSSRAESAIEARDVVKSFGQLVPELTAEENVALPLLLAG